MKRLPCLSDHIFSLVDIVDLVLEEHDSLLGLLPVGELLDHLVHSGQPGVEVLDGVVVLQTVDLAADLGLYIGQGLLNYSRL